MAMQTEEEPSCFFVLITGQIEGADFGGADNLYCKYSISFGNDWEVITGVTGGLSQIAKKGPADVHASGGAVTWNFPIYVAFKSTNAFGWPRITVTVYGVDPFGRDVTHGYGSVLVPVQSGQSEHVLTMFRPLPSSFAQRLQNLWTGTYPEYFDSTFVAQGHNREVTRTQSTGDVLLQLQVATKDMAKFGYSSTVVAPSPLQFSTQTVGTSNMLGNTMRASANTLGSDA